MFLIFKRFSIEKNFVRKAWHKREKTYLVKRNCLIFFPGFGIVYFSGIISIKIIIIRVAPVVKIIDRKTPYCFTVSFGGFSVV